MSLHSTEPSPHSSVNTSLRSGTLNSNECVVITTPFPNSAICISLFLCGDCSSDRNVLSFLKAWFKLYHPWESFPGRVRTSLPLVPTCSKPLFQILPHCNVAIAQFLLTSQWTQGHWSQISLGQSQLFHLPAFWSWGINSSLTES